MVGKRIFRYQVVCDEIIKRIERGEWKADAPIPPLIDLESLLPASRMTILRSLHLLQEKGFLRMVHGSGTFVCRELPTARKARKMKSERQLQARRHSAARKSWSSNKDKIRLGVIGCGLRATSVLQTLLKNYAECEISAVADANLDYAVAQLSHRSLPYENTVFHAGFAPLLEQADGLDALIIGSRCHQHTPMAVQAAAARLPMFLEKPVAVNDAQLTELAGTATALNDRIVVSFPLRLTPILQRVLAIVASGRLGEITQVQAVNNVPYGGHYFGGHYRNYHESGGLWLQKATHDFDVINQLMGVMPEKVSAMASQVAYGGEKPEPLRCSECPDNGVCPESPEFIRNNRENDAGGTNVDNLDGENFDHFCCFSESIQNQDVGSALIRYTDGRHASYSQNFIARRSARKRGAVVIGYSATLEFDFRGDIQIIDHHSTADPENITVEVEGGHSGGDEKLLDNFIEIIRGEAVSESPLSAGILSVAMCLAARRAAWNDSVESISFPAELSPPYPSARKIFTRPEPPRWGAEPAPAI